MALLDYYYVIESETPRICVKNQHGLSIGGCDWNKTIVDHVIGRLLDEYEVSLNEDDYCQLYDAVELAKQKYGMSSIIKIPVCVNGSRKIIEIEKADFEKLTTNLLEKLLQAIDICINNENKIDKLLISGGGSLLPTLRDAIEKRFPGKVWIEDPLLASVKGAAAYAANL